MFKTAKKLSNAATEPKGKKKERELVAMKGVEELAHLDAVIKSATAAKSAVENVLTETVQEMFMDRIQKAGGKKPDSFYGAEGLAEVNFQLRKRGTNSALNEEERKILDQAKIEYKEEVITPELYAINPLYAADAKLLEKVEKALAKLGLPEDFIVMQEKKTKFVIDDSAMGEALKSGDSEVVKIATTLAFKPMLTEMIPSEVAKTVEKILGISTEAEVAEEEEKPVKKAAAKKPAKK